MNELDAIAALYAVFAEDPTLTQGSPPVRSLPDVTKVYDHEPGTHSRANPVAITLACIAADRTDLTLSLRIYADLGMGPRQAWAVLYGLRPSVEDLIPPEFGGPTFQWTYAYLDGIEAVVAELQLQTGRDDF